jgi:hypothetical protein
MVVRGCEESMVLKNLPTLLSQRQSQSTDIEILEFVSTQHVNCGLFIQLIDVVKSGNLFCLVLSIGMCGWRSEGALE